MLNYMDVMSGAIQPEVYGPITVIKYVSWDDVPVEGQLAAFLTLGVVFVHTPPVLPHWCQMRCHTSWYHLCDRILEGWQDATFQELDAKMLDLEFLSEITKHDWMSDNFPPYEHRQDWADWSAQIEDAWDDLPDQIKKLSQSAVPHLSPYVDRTKLLEHLAEHGFDDLPVTNRVMPPSLVNALKLMLAQAEANLEPTSASPSAVSPLNPSKY